MNKKQDQSDGATLWDNPRFRNWVAVARACQLVGQAMTRELRDLDIKPPHLDIMMNVMRHDGMTQHELARKLLVGRSNITMLLPQMEKRGLIKRKPDLADRRILRLSLTDEGRALTRKGMEIQGRLIDEIMALSSADDCHLVGETMRRACERLLEIAQEADTQSKEAAE